MAATAGHDHARELTRPELRRTVEQLALQARRWSHLVRHDPSQRVFERVVETAELEAWLICWMPGQDTGFHDHDLSSGAVTVVAGEGEQPAVTLHVYSPRLRRMGAYAVARDGELQRHPLAYGEELRPFVV